MNDFDVVISELEDLALMAKAEAPTSGTVHALIEAVEQLRARLKVPEKPAEKPPIVVAPPAKPASPPPGKPLVDPSKGKIDASKK